MQELIIDIEKHLIECDCGHIVNNSIEHTFWFEDKSGKDLRLCKKCMMVYCAIDKLFRGMNKSHDN